MVLCNDQSSRLTLLSLLADASPTIVSSAALTGRMGMTRQAVFKLAHALREEGLPLESIPQKGYALKNICDIDALSPTLVDYLLRADKLFAKCLFFPEVDSTQLILKKLAAQGAPQGMVAVSERQTLGRGRRGRSWSSPRGRNLYFSILLRPKLAYGEVQLLNLAAGLAVRSALKEDFGVAAELKWPNDVLANGKKICGILSEAAGEPDLVHYTVTGIGVNVNLASEEIEPELVGCATSIFIETGKRAPRPRLLAGIFGRLSALAALLVADKGKEKLLRIYRENCATLGREVRVLEEGRELRGVARDITEQGAIIVNIDGEDKLFSAADVQHLRIIE